mgnify:FL=1
MIGTTISHYKILEKLGEGGMGVVYKAQDLKLDRLVALKFLPHHMPANEAEKARFLQEAKAASALNHPNVCTIYGIEEQAGQQYIEMEYVDGKTIREKLQSGPLSMNDAITYAIQIAEALLEAHSKGVVHRDIKPDNIMINSRELVKVMDFGLARLKGTLRQTRTSSTAGTLAYMAPEQIQGGNADARSDIFAFAVVLFEMITSKLPFRGEHDSALMYSIVNEEPQSILNYIPKPSSELLHIFNKALEKDPNDRHQSAAELVVDLRRLKKDTSKVVRSKDFQIATGEEKPRQRIIKTAVGLLLIGLIATTLLILNTADKIDSVAVLPLANDGADPNTEYLSEGLSESIIRSLSSISNIKIRPWSTVVRYRNTRRDAKSIGDELHVHAVLQGSVEQRGERIFIRVELIDVKDDVHLWGKTYNYSMANIVSVQEDIAKEVAEKLRAKISGLEATRLESRMTDNPEAYQFYLQGQYSLGDLYSKDSWKQALAQFGKALEKDTNYALAYVGIGDTYASISGFHMPPSEAMVKAQRAVTRALALDNNLPEALVTLARIRMWYEWDLQSAEALLIRSIGIKKDLIRAYQSLWYCYMYQGKFEEALAHLRQARDLDPVSTSLQTMNAWTFYYQRQFERAIEESQKIVRLNPINAESYIILGLASEQTGKFDQAFEAWTKYLSLTGESEELLTSFEVAYVEGGYERYAAKHAEYLTKLSRTVYVDPFRLARLFVSLGKKDEAIEWLTKAYELRIDHLLWLKVDPLFDSIRSDKRFKDLLSKVIVKE